MFGLIKDYLLLRKATESQKQALRSIRMAYKQSETIYKRIALSLTEKALINEIRTK